ncbi:MAG: hypothetical protein V1792_25680 [Pseudomonadota bacterium]
MISNLLRNSAIVVSSHVKNTARGWRAVRGDLIHIDSFGKKTNNEP